MTIRRLFALTAALVLFTAPAAADGTRVIQIRVDGTPEFDVVYHRALTNATGAVIGGLIGAGIQAGIEADKDGDKRKALRQYISEDVWQAGFVKTLSDALAAKGFEPVWAEGKASPKDAKADVYLVLFPTSYGFRMVDSTTQLVSAYVEFEASYASKPITSRSSTKEPFYLTDRKQAPYEELAKETAVLNGEVESVLSLAARRLANKIIYNVK